MANSPIQVVLNTSNIIEERIKKAWEEKRKEKDLTQKTLFGDGM